MAGSKRVKALMAAALTLLLGACATPAVDEAGAVRPPIVREHIVFNRGAWIIIDADVEDKSTPAAALTAERAQ
jgi:hypothetical protein